MDGQVQARSGGYDVPGDTRALGQQAGQAHDPAGARPAGHAPRGVPVPAGHSPGPPRPDAMPVPDGGHTVKRGQAAADRLETAATLGIVLVLGSAAFAASYTHVQRVAERAGQHGWVSWAIATSVELMAIGSGLEMKRRRKHRQPVKWPQFTLGLGITMSLAANLATAGPGPWGYAMAAWPVVAFGGVVGWIETRRPVVPAPVVPAEAGRRAPGVVPAVPAPPAHVPVPAERPAPAVPVPVLPPASPVVHASVPAPAPARRVAAARAPRPTVVVPLPTSGEGQDSGHKMSADEAQAWYRSHLDAGRDPSVAEMVAATGMKERWVKIQRQAVKRAWKAEQARQAEQAATG